jgi:hypothetical protein
MISSDGKYYKTDVADTEQLFRLIQSIPSKKSGNLIFQALIRGSAGMKNGINTTSIFKISYIIIKGKRLSAKRL